MDRAEAIKTLKRHKTTCLLSGMFDVEEAIDMAIAALREQERSPWISVKDDIPKRMKRYFIAYEFEGSDMRFYGEAMFHPEGGNGCVDRQHFSNEGVDGMYVTHWMEIPKLPLPEPPKEGADHE